MKCLPFCFAALLFLRRQQGAYAIRSLQEGLEAPLLQQAAVSCNAAYSAPCARTNSQFLAEQAASVLNYILVSNSYQTAAEADEALRLGFFQDVTDGKFNLDTGFYPFKFRWTVLLRRCRISPQQAARQS